MIGCLLHYLPQIYHKPTCSRAYEILSSLRTLPNTHYKADKTPYFGEFSCNMMGMPN